MGGFIMNDDNSLDLLDLDDNDSMDALPETTPFAAPRPKKPWLLWGVSAVIIVLATFIIVRTVGDDSSSSMEVDLDVPAIVVDGTGAPVDMNVLPPTQPVKAQPQPQQVQPTPVVVPPVQVQPQPQQPAPVVQPEPQPTAGIPVRVVEERKEVKFNPAAEEKQTVKPRTTTAPAKVPVTKPAAKSTAKQAVKTQTARPAAGSWYVQFGSYSTRELAQAAQRKIQAAHQSLFAGKQFVILAAQLQNGSTTYRLRVAFQNAKDANGFCRNAKSDGLDCYVAK